MELGSIFRSSVTRTAAVLVILTAGPVVAVAIGGSPAGAITPGYGEGSSFCSSVVTGAYNLGASFDNIYACGPQPGGGFPSYGDSFQPQGGFQCTELANRFLFDIYGWCHEGSNVRSHPFVTSAWRH